MEEYFAFEKLVIWQEAVRFANSIYKYTQDFPKSEFYGLTNQMRRAAISISLNIAEGKGRYSKKEFVQFLYIARGSLYEVVTCLKLSLEMQYIAALSYGDLRKDAMRLQLLISRMINAMKS